jgi:thymidylate synthase (FAD)
MSDLLDRLTFRDGMSVDLVDHMGSDASVVAAARVSVVGSGAAMFEQADAAEHRGLINYLMKARHGTPFEHNSITVRVEAPLFVYREWHRHRVPWSYNEESARYKQLDPVFHIPGPERPLINAGTSARPRLVAGNPRQYADLVHRMKRTYAAAYAAYETSLMDGVAKEVAREVLPVGTYSTMYATSNIRGIMNFLALRTEDDRARFPSKPQYEIAQAAAGVEAIFAELFPLVYEAWNEAGRVAP